MRGGEEEDREEHVARAALGKREHPGGPRVGPDGERALRAQEEPELQRQEQPAEPGGDTR